MWVSSFFFSSLTQKYQRQEIGSRQQQSLPGASSNSTASDLSLAASTISAPGSASSCVSFEFPASALLALEAYGVEGVSK